MNEFKITFLKILDIINYKDDKEKHANEFIFLSANKALFAYMKDLPEEQKNQIMQNKNMFIDPVKFGLETKKYIDEKKYLEILNNLLKSTLMDYLNAVYPSLSPKQYHDLKEYLKTIYES